MPEYTFDFDDKNDQILKELAKEFPSKGDAVREALWILESIVRLRKEGYTEIYARKSGNGSKEERTFKIAAA